MPAPLSSLRRCARTLLATTALSLGLPLAALQAQTVNVVMHAPLRALDPVISTAYIVRNYGYMVYDTLLARDSKGNVQPQMASWSVSDDGRTYTFTLREGLKWHDGKPVTADDAVASIRRWSAADKLGQVMASTLTDMQVIDAQSFSMTFSAPTDFVLHALSKPSGVPPFMFPKDVAETPVSEPITSAIGSGPFVFSQEDYQPGVQAVFKKFEDYVPRPEPADGLAGGKVVQVDAVRWITMPDAMTAVSALLGGEVDIVEQVPHDLLPLLEGNPDIDLRIFAKQAVQNMARMNFLHPPFDNLKIRQAAMLAVGQKDLLDAQVGNPEMYTLCPAVFGCTSIYADDYGADRLLEPQPEKARALLSEAGYDGTPVYLLHATDNVKIAPMGPVLAQQLRNGGFTVNLVSLDWASVAARRASKAPPQEGGWSMFSTTNVLPDVGDPVGFVAVAAGGEKTGWFGWADVPAIEAARIQFAASSDPAERKALASEIHKLVIDHVVMLPMGETAIKTASRTSIAFGVDGEAPAFWNLTKADD